MRSGFDFTSWQGVLTTFLGLAVVTLVVVGVRLLVMQTVQRRRERENRQINERLRTLIAAYKVLGGSFTGDLAVDPAHLRDLMRAARQASADPDSEETVTAGLGSDRRRRIRDAVEAALSDVILLGTADQVRLAVAAANDLVAGRPVETAELVSALRTFIRAALDLEPVPELDIPRQGPARPTSSGLRSGAKGQARPERSAKGGTGAAGAGGAAGIGLVGLHDDTPP